MTIRPLNLRTLIIGNPIETAMAQHERITKVKALAVFSSDALSSVAYATEEILFVLILAGTAGLQMLMPIAACDCVPAFYRGYILLSNDPCLPKRRRGLHRLERKFRHSPRSDSWWCVDDRIHPDGYGIHRSWGWCDLFCNPSTTTLSRDHRHLRYFSDHDD